MTTNTPSEEKDAEPLSDHFDAVSDYEFNQRIRKLLNEAVDAALDQVSPVDNSPEWYIGRLKARAQLILFGTITENDIDGYGVKNLRQWIAHRIEKRRLPANGVEPTRRGDPEWTMTHAEKDRYTWKTDAGGVIWMTGYEPGVWGLHYDDPVTRDTDEWNVRFIGTTKQVREAIESVFRGEAIVLPDRVRQ